MTHKEIQDEATKAGRANAVDAERERDEAFQRGFQAGFHHPGNVDEAMKAAITTARSEALREALEAVKGIDTADIYSTGERHAAEEIRGFAMFLIGKLINQPTNTGDT